MSETPPVKNQYRPGSLLLVIGLLGLVLTSIFLSRRSVNEAQKASTSLYRDRLVPSGILVNLTSAIFRKRLVLETHVLTAEKRDIKSVSMRLERLNRRIDSLLAAFQQTKLTTEEANGLRLLKQRLIVYNLLEAKLTTKSAASPNTQLALFTSTGNTAFSQVIQILDELSGLQLTVGEKLLGKSSGQTNYIYVMTALQIGLVLMIGLSMFWHRF